MWSTFARTAVVIQRYKYVVQTSGSYKNVARRWCHAPLVDRHLLGSKAKIIVEPANGPTTQKADKILLNNKMHAISDFIGNKSFATQAGCPRCLVAHLTSIIPMLMPNRQAD